MFQTEHRVERARRFETARSDRRGRNRFRPQFLERLEDRLVLTGPDLGLVSSVNGGSFLIGQTITYTLTIQNQVSADPILLGLPINVTDVVPSGFSNVTASASSGWSFTNNLTTSPSLITASYTGAYPIIAGETLPTITVTGQANGDSLGIIANVSSVNVLGDSNLANNTSTTEIDIEAPPPILPSSLFVSSTPGTYGGTTDLSATLTSDGIPVSGEFIDFRLGATDFGMVPTNNLGIAERNGVSLGSLDVGSYLNVGASFAGDSNFEPSASNTFLTVNPAPLTITTNNTFKVYGQTNPTFTGIITGLLPDDDVSAFFTTTATQFSDVQAGGYPITLLGLGGAKEFDYSLSVAGASFTPGTLTVTPAPLTVMVASQSKVYGQVTPPLTGLSTGAFNGDDVSVIYGTAATQFSDVRADGYAITPIGLSGTKAGDYSTTVPDALVTPGTLMVSPAPLAVLVNNQSKVYGQTNPSLTGLVGGVFNGDSVTAQYLTAATTTSHVMPGGYIIVFAGLSGPKGGDYSVTTSIPGSLTVTPAPLTITASNGTKVYGQANPTFSASNSGFVLGQGPSALAGSLILQSSATPASHVGQYAITPSGLNSSDYAIHYVPGTLSITPAILQVTAVNAHKVYGQAVPTLTATYSGFVNGDTAARLTTPVKLTTTASSASHVGVYSITASGATSGDYTIHFTNGALAVTPATLTVTPVNMIKAYDVPVPTLTATYSGFVNGDTAARLTSPVKLTTTATALSGVGIYSIIASGGASADYTIHYVQGALAIPPNLGQIGFVTSLYETLLGRKPEASGLAGWLTRLSNGQSLSDVANLIYLSPEATVARANHTVPIITEATAYNEALLALQKAMLS